MIDYEAFERRENRFEIEWDTGHGRRDLELRDQLLLKLNLKEAAYSVTFEVVHTITSKERIAGYKAKTLRPQVLESRKQLPVLRLGLVKLRLVRSSLHSQPGDRP